MGEAVRAENRKALSALDKILSKTDDNSEFSDEDLEEEPKARKAAKLADSRQNRKLFVGGLPWKAESEEVRDFFEKCGDIDSFNMPANKNTGKPMGIAFIIFSSRAGLEMALRLDGKNYRGQKLRIKEADPDHGKGGSGGKGSRADGGGKGGGRGH